MNESEWRDALKPLFVAMHDEGVERAEVTRTGDDCHFELWPDGEYEPPLPPDALLVMAIRKSHKMLKHYSELLNMHDGGQRVIPEHAEQWIERIRECNGMSGPGPLLDMTEPEKRQLFSGLARLIEGLLPPGPSKKGKCLFALLVFDNTGTAEYLSNANREDMLAGMRETIARFEAGDVVDR